MGLVTAVIAVGRVDHGRPVIWAVGVVFGSMVVQGRAPGVLTVIGVGDGATTALRVFFGGMVVVVMTKPSAQDRAEEEHDNARAARALSPASHRSSRSRVLALHQASLLAVDPLSSAELTRGLHRP